MSSGLVVDNGGTLGIRNVLHACRGACKAYRVLVRIPEYSFCISSTSFIGPGALMKLGESSPNTDGSAGQHMSGEAKRSYMLLQILRELNSDESVLD